MTDESIPPRRRYPAQSRPISRVELRLSGEECFHLAIRECVAWIVRHAGVRIPNSAFDGEPFATGPDARAPVEAQRIVHQDRDYWFFQLHDPDRDVPARRWDAGAVVRHDENGATILVLLDVLLGGGDIEALKRQLEFRRTVPGLVRQLLEKLECRVGEWKVAPSLLRVDNAQSAEELTGDLFDEDRTMPLIVFSEPERGRAANEQKALEYAARLAGIAECVLLDEQCAWRLTEALGKEWSVFNGAIRVYHPGISTSGTTSPYDHPIFLRNRGEQFEAYVDHLIRETTTGKNQLPSPRTLFHVHYQQSLAPEVISGEDGASPQHVRLLEKKIEELSTDIEGYEGLLIDAGKLETRVTTEIRKLIDDNEILEERIAHLTDELSAAEQALGKAGILSYRSLSRYDIEDADQFQKWADAVLTPYVAFSGRSLDGLAAFKNVTLDEGYLPRLSRAFFAIREVVRGANFNALGDEYRGWQVEVARCFANRNDIKNFRGYDILIDGEPQKMEWHAKWGRDRDIRSSFRIYFYWDEEGRRATVGHFPDHLPNNLT